MFRLSEGEEIMTLAFFILMQYRSVTDGRTDGQTDGHLCSGYTSACIACYANALVKMAHLFGCTINVDLTCRASDQSPYLVRQYRHVLNMTSILIVLNFIRTRLLSHKI